MVEEMKSLHMNKNLAFGSIPIKSMSCGLSVRFKARIMAKIFTQVKGIDYNTQQSGLC